jgi:hypothetical protein
MSIQQDLGGAVDPPTQAGSLSGETDGCLSTEQTDQKSASAQIKE